MQRVPDVFEIPEPMRGKPLPWLTALAMTAIVVVATLALVVANEVPSESPQVAVDRWPTRVRAVFSSSAAVRWIFCAVSDVGACLTARRRAPA